jgi:DNA-directed RNA polymerase subunit M/transcription elongation factor TFIIS
MPLPYDSSRCTCPRCLNVSASLAPALAEAHGDATLEHLRCENCAYTWTRARRAHIVSASPTTAPGTRAVCPRCLQKTDAFIPWMSDSASMEYFRCQDCGHVWQVKTTGSEHAQPPIVRPE